VAVLVALTVALPTLPPEVSTILPESVAFTAWPNALGGLESASMVAERRNEICRNATSFDRFTTHPLRWKIHIFEKDLGFLRVDRVFSAPTSKASGLPDPV
jgi:hypothetical protein